MRTIAALIALTVGSWGITPAAFGQDLPKPDYPVIFIHGLTSNADDAWGDLRDYLVGQGWTWGEAPTYEPDDGAVIGMTEDPDADFYTMNMSDWRAEFPSQNLTLSEQGGQVAAVIDRVLEVTGKGKVILVGHSMGGLAARSYLQELAVRDGMPVAYADDVVNLITVSTPHLGAEWATVCSATARFRLCEIRNINSSSIAVDEMRADSEAMVRLNNTQQYPLPFSVSYTSIVDTGKKVWGFEQYGDGIVSAWTQNMDNVVHPGELAREAVQVNVDPDNCSLLEDGLNITHSCATSDPVVWAELFDQFRALSTDDATPSDAPLSLTMAAGPDPVRPGERANYTLTVTNPSSTTRTNVTLRSLLPGYLSSYSFSGTGADCPGGRCDAGETATWLLGELPPGQSRTVFYSFEVYSRTAEGTILRGLATASADGVSDVTAAQDVVVTSTPTLQLSAAADRSPVAAGERLVYRLSYANAGASSVSGPALRTVVPAGVRVVAASGEGVVDGDEVTWDLGTLAPSERGQQTLVVEVSPAAGDGQIFSMRAELRDAAGLQTTAHGTIATVVRRDAELQLDLTAGPDPVRPGERVSYALTVTNPGSTTRTNVTLRSLLPGYLSSYSFSGTGADCPGGRCDAGETATWLLGELPPGQSRTVFYSFEVYSRTAEGTILRGLATASADGVSDVTAAQDVVVTSTPTLQLSAAADRSPVAAGERLVYRLSYANAGASSVSGAALRTVVPAGVRVVAASGEGVVDGDEVTWDLGTLAPNESGHRTLTLEAPPEVVRNLVMHAVLSNSVGSGQLARSKVMSVLENQELALAMKANPDPVRPSERVSYALTVTNPGSTTRTNVTLRSLLPGYLSSYSFSGTGAGCPGGRCDGGETATWVLGELPPGQSRTVFYSFEVYSRTPEGTILQGLATASADGVSDVMAAQDVIVDSTPEPVPVITRVEPNPVIGANSPQPFTLHGREFAAGATVTLRDYSTAEVFPERTIVSQSSTRITISPVFTTTPAMWSVEVINPDGHPSGELLFEVVAPEAVTAAAVPVATSFRMPIGGAAGDNLELLTIDAFSTFDYPKIRFNDNGDFTADPNEWYVATAFNRNRYLNLGWYDGLSDSPTSHYDDFNGDGAPDYHPGEDWNLTTGGDTDEGSTVYAIADGIVLFNGCAYGRTLILAHKTVSEEYITSFYGHLQATLNLPIGRAVKKGDPIGTVGKTVGTSCAESDTMPAHLHFEIRKGTMVAVDEDSGTLRLAHEAAMWPASTYPEDNGSGFIADNYYNPAAFLKAATGVAVDPGDGDLPGTFALHQNYPNPFNPVTTIPYEVAEAGPVTLTVYDVLGRQVLTLVDAYHMPGRYAVRFDARSLPSGPYLYRLQAGSYTETRPLMLLK